MTAQAAPSLHHRCAGADGRPLEATSRYYRYHRKQGEPPCGWSKACNSLSVWLAAHPDLTAADYPGYTPLDDIKAQATHRCSPADGQPVELTNAYYEQHRRRGTPPCGWSKACLSFYTWQRKHPDQPPDSWPGYIPRVSSVGLNHVCGAADIRPLEATVRYYTSHRKHGEPPCGWAKACSAFYQWQWNNPDKPASAYKAPPDPNRPHRHTCGPADSQPLEATSRFVDEHRYRGTLACDWSRACYSFHRWQRSNPDKAAGDYPGYRSQAVRQNPDRPMRHSCGPADHLPLEATNAYTSEHRNRGIPDCAWSKACGALYYWLANHPSKSAGDYPGYRSREEISEQATHNCATADEQPIEATSKHYQRHLDADEAACEWSNACNSLRAWLANNPGKSTGDYPGYISQAERSELASHECAAVDERPVEATIQHREHHRRHDTEPCGWSMACSALYFWLLKHPNKSEADYPGYSSMGDRSSPDRPYSHDCGPVDGRQVEGSYNYDREHRYRGTRPCDFSLACNALAVWLDKHPHLTEADYPGWREGTVPRSNRALPLPLPRLHRRTASGLLRHHQHHPRP